MNRNRELIIIGTGGLAKEIAQLARQIDPQNNRWASIDYAAESEDQLGIKISYGKVRWLDQDLISRERPCDVVIGIGHPKLRHKIYDKLSNNPNLTYPNLIHPAVEIDDGFVNIGFGNIVTKGVIMTCDISIQNFNLFNWNVTIGHDTDIGSFNVFNPGTNISGYSIIKDDSLFGTGSQVLERLSIASNTTIGAGAVVTKSITESDGIYIGIPARIML